MYPYEVYYEPVKRHPLRKLFAFILILAVAFVGFTGSGILLRHDPAAWLPHGFPGTQQLREWAKQLGLITAEDANSLPPPGPRPIIFLPGIMGSLLTDSSGNEVWPQAQSLAGCVGANIPLVGDLIPPLGGISVDAACEGQKLQSIALSSNAPSAVDVANGVAHPTHQDNASPGDTVEPLGGVLGSVSASGGTFFWTVSKTLHFYDITAENAQLSGYTVAHSDNANGLGACAGVRRCFVPIGFDWRRSAEFNADRVLDVIDAVLAITGSDRVDILAHSQGGLVANAVVHSSRSIGKVYRIVTLGTPFLGAPKVAAILLDGQCAFADLPFGGGCPIPAQILQQLASTFPGTAELEPSRAYFRAAVPIGPPLFSNTTPLDASQAMLALNSAEHGLIGGAETWHNAVDKWSPLDANVRLLRMVGYAAATQGDVECTTAPCNGQQARVNPSGTIVAANTTPYDAPGYGDGDGSVPLFSASLYDPQSNFDDRGGAHDMYWCSYSHMGLAHSTAVWQASKQYLEGTSDPSRDSIGAMCPYGGAGTVATAGLVG